MNSITVTINFLGVGAPLVFKNVVGYDHDTPGVFSVRPVEGQNVFFNWSTIASIDVLQTPLSS